MILALERFSTDMSRKRTAKFLQLHHLSLQSCSFDITWCFPSFQEEIQSVLCPVLIGSIDKLLI